MKARSINGSVFAPLKAVCVAAALACGCSAGMAAEAALKITSFSVSAVEFSGLYVLASNPYQSFGMTAQNAGGGSGQAVDNFSANNWDLGLNRLAQTSSAIATGNTVQFTDASTSMTTAGFNLAAQALNNSFPPALPNYANAGAVQSGSFTLLDESGQGAAGTLTFDVYYDMSVTAPDSVATRYSQTSLSVLSTSDGGGRASFSDGLLSSAFAGGTGSTSGHFTWSYALVAGQMANYTLSGDAVAVGAIPEPETYALMALGLVAVGAYARRRRSAGS